MKSTRPQMLYSDPNGQHLMNEPLQAQILTNYDYMIAEFDLIVTRSTVHIKKKCQSEIN